MTALSMMRYCKTSTPPFEKWASLLNDWKPTDSGNARIFQNYAADKVRFNHTSNKWLIYNGTHYEPDETGRIHGIIDELIIELVDMAKDQNSNRAELLRNLYKLENIPTRQRMLSMAAAFADFATTENQWDTGDILTFTNTNLVISSGKLVQHSPEILNSVSFNFGFMPKAYSEKWIQFLRDIFNNDDELIQFIGRLLGGTLAGDRLQNFIFLYGSGKNGKGTFTEIIRELFGELAAKIPSEILMKNGTPADRGQNEMARLTNRRFVYANEVEDGNKYRESFLKEITSKEMITARRLNEKSFEFKARFTLWISGNYKPIIRGTDEGMWRRVILVPFTVEIPEDKRREQSEILEEMHAEQEGIFSFIWRGLQDLKQNGLMMPAIVADAVKEYKSESDIISQFINTTCISGTDKMDSTKNLYENFQTYCQNEGEKPMSQRKFTSELKRRYNSRIGTDRKTIIEGIEINLFNE